MTLPDGLPNHEKMFHDKKIYYSGTIRGIPNADPNFPWNLVQFMINNGANVLDEHVGARNREEMGQIFHRKSGIEISAIADKTERAKVARRVDLEWVREATHFIALVTTPSIGVGIEIQETIRKPDLGFNKTLMLFLVAKDVVDKDALSNMVTGIDPEIENVDFEIGVYETEEEAKNIITNFLLKH